MKAMWTGQLGFGLVNMPVKLYKATDSHDIELHQYVVTNEGIHRVGRKNIDLETGATIDYADIVSGAEVDDQIVVVTKDERASLDQEAGKFIEIEQFVEASEIDPLRYDAGYYLGANKGGEKPYALLVHSMVNSGLVAVAQFTLRGRTQRAVIRVADGRLVLHTLLWADEIRPATELTVTASFSEAEQAAAELLVESMVGKFDPDAHSDTYQERLAELIAAKAAGVEFEIPKTMVATDDVSDLLAKLEASIVKKEAVA